MDITNQSDLEKAMGDLLEDVIKEVSEKMLLQLRKNILRYTYGTHGKNKDYYDGSKHPTYEFLYSWKLSGISKVANEVTRELFQEWENMSYDAPTWLHGSIVSNPNDVRETLADILNKKGYSSDLFLSVYHEPYWDVTTDQLFDGGYLDKWFTEALQNRGVI